MLPMADGTVYMASQDGAVVVLRERTLQAKLDLLFSKHLYLVALSLAQTEQVHTGVACLAMQLAGSGQTVCSPLAASWWSLQVHDQPGVRSAQHAQAQMGVDLRVAGV